MSDHIALERLAANISLAAAFAACRKVVDDDIKYACENHNPGTSTEEERRSFEDHLRTLSLIDSAIELLGDEL